MKSIRTNPTVHGAEGDERIRTAVPDVTNDPVWITKLELAALLASGDVKSALLLKGDFTDQERALIRQAYEAGLAHGARRVETELARLQEGLRDACDFAESVLFWIDKPSAMDANALRAWTGRILAYRALLAEEGEEA